MSQDSNTEGHPDLPNLGPLYLTLGIVAMSNTILASALPTVSADLSGTSDYIAIVTAYLLPKALTTPIGGRLVDAVSPKKVVLGFASCYLLTTIACGLVQTMDQLLLLRVFQGIGGGGLLASVYVIMDLLVPPRFQGRVQARVAMVFGGGAAAAPLVGGLITEYLGWRWCFFGNVPPLILSFVALTRLPDLKPKGRLSVDWKGAGLLALTSSPLLMALTWGGVKYPWSSPYILSLFALSVVAGWLFWKMESVPDEPLFDPNLARGPVLRWSFLACFTVGGAFLGSLLFLPLFMVAVEGYGQTLAGVSMLPFIVGSIVGSVYGGGRVEDTGRYKRLAVIASGAASLLSLSLYFLLEHFYILWVYFVLQFVLGFAFGVAQDIYGIAVQNDTVASRQGMAGSALEFVRQLGSALGLSVVGTIFLLSLSAVMPQEIDRWLKPLGVEIIMADLEDADHLREMQNKILKALTRKTDEAASGQQSAYEELKHSHILSPSLKASLDPKNGSPGLTPGELKAVSHKIDQALMKALRGAVVKAQARVYLLSAFLCLLAFGASLRLPDEVLRSALKEGEEAMPDLAAEDEI